MSPPQLAADAPIADVFQPVVIYFRKALGHDLDTPVAHRLQAASASGFIFTNHCVLTSGSTTSPPRWERAPA